MRLRDVFSAHPPLIGLPGRIGSFRHQGSHPGPLSFWALAPFYEKSLKPGPYFGLLALIMMATAIAFIPISRRFERSPDGPAAA